LNNVRKVLFILIPAGLCLLAYHAMLDSFAEPSAKPKPVGCCDHGPNQTKVPAAQLEKVKAMKNPVPANANSLAMAKIIYNGKGTCTGCHGPLGKGDGELGVSLDTPPRNFTDHEWQKARTDGELFWIIENGTETGMISFGGMISDSEIWALVGYVRSLGK
jgi:mono/diheme cytochrome c family protein